MRHVANKCNLRPDLQTRPYSRRRFAHLAIWGPRQAEPISFVSVHLLVEFQTPESIRSLSGSSRKISLNRANLRKLCTSPARCRLILRGRQNDMKQEKKLEETDNVCEPGVGGKKKQTKRESFETRCTRPCRGNNGRVDRATLSQSRQWATAHRIRTDAAHLLFAKWYGLSDPREEGMTPGGFLLEEPLFEKLGHTRPWYVMRYNVVDSLD